MPAVAFSPQDLESVEISAHIQGSTAIMHWFSVPAGRRRTGLGTAAYQAWEAGLPKSVRLVRLFAANTEGDGNSDGFWSALGFGYVYRAEDDQDYESAHAMHKGVNGAQTPKPR